MQSNLFVCCLLLLCVALGEAATRKPKKQPAPEASNKAKADPEPTDASQPKTLARGWGDSIEWVQTYEEALAKSRETRKPLMVIHHLEDCPFSQELKKAFSADNMAQRLAQNDFVMLNVVIAIRRSNACCILGHIYMSIIGVMHIAEPKKHPVADENQSPDGHYVPRVMFVDPSMTVRTDLAGRYSNRLYAYEAGDIPELITNMKKAKILLKTEL